jgi:2-polyprenyl-6-methoxyphenol hydroxylase-like FAD-dependent oxidoreductase
MSPDYTGQIEADIPVVIVGGSLVGLSAAMFLAARGIRCMVVERHRRSALHPRAQGFTARTLEMFDTAGLRKLPEVPPSSTGLRRIRAESITGTWKEETYFTPKGALNSPAKPPAAAPSPHVGAAISQDRIEPLLRQRAIELGATLCLGTELARFEDREDGITAWLKGSEGTERAVRAAYLIGCDGNRSFVRESLGIERQGVGVIQIMRSVLFRADLERFRCDGVQFEIEQPDLQAFLAGYGDGRWVLMFRDDVERDELTLAAAIQQAIGTPVPVEILTTGRWEVTALIADRFRQERVFLAGDSAHTLPPNRGGFGANTGIADAFNLAWKLAAVLSGQSKVSLLDSYEEERRPVAWMRFQQIFARADYGRHADDTLRATPLLDEIAIEFGELYRSRIIEGASPDLPLARRPDEWQGQPGTRAPHRVVTRDGQFLSTLELYGEGWVLVSSSKRWCEAAAAMRQRKGIAVTAINLRAEFGPVDGALVEQDLGISDKGASLVRPDGVIAWRTSQEDGSIDALVHVMEIAAQPTSQPR